MIGGKENSYEWVCEALGIDDFSQVTPSPSTLAHLLLYQRAQQFSPAEGRRGDVTKSLVRTLRGAHNQFRLLPYVSSRASGIVIPRSIELCPSEQRDFRYEARGGVNHYQAPEVVVDFG